VSHGYDNNSLCVSEEIGGCVNDCNGNLKLCVVAIKHAIEESPTKENNKSTYVQAHPSLLHLLTSTHYFTSTVGKASAHGKEEELDKNNRDFGKNFSLSAH
jgi:hypothetical protein